MDFPVLKVFYLTIHAFDDPPGEATSYVSVQDIDPAFLAISVLDLPTGCTIFRRIYFPRHDTCIIVAVTVIRPTRVG